MYFFFTIPFWIIILAAVTILGMAAFAAGIAKIVFPYFAAGATIIWLVALVYTLGKEKRKRLWPYRFSQWLLSAPFMTLLFEILAEFVVGKAILSTALSIIFVLPLGFLPLVLLDSEDNFEVDPKKKTIRPFSIILNSIVGLGPSFFVASRYSQTIIDALIIAGWIK